MKIHNPTITGSLIISGSLVVNGDPINAGGSTDISLLNSFTASQETKNTALATYTSSVDTKFTAIASSTSSLNSKTGSYATTGSNIFQGNQTITGSLYILQDLVVQGSSSINYISQSVLNIGTNLITVNAATPSVRFAGLAVIDSGSGGGSGSILYDSTHDEFLFVHKGNGTNVTSSHFIMGPETYDNLGNETYLITNRLPKGTGNEHLTNSNITDTGTNVTINSDTTLSGSVNISGSLFVNGGQITTGGTGMTLIESQSWNTSGTYTWNKPAGAQIISVILVGAGGGGASGAAAVGSGVAGGTGGGGAGGVVMMTLPASSFNVTESVVVGAGGAGGTANSRIGAGANATTAGNNGNAGGSTSFGELIAAGGNGGAYTAANNALGLGGAPISNPSFTTSNTLGYTLDAWTTPIAMSGPGGSGAATDKDPVAVAALTMSTFVPTGGGFGGTPGNTAIVETGGAGGFSTSSFGGFAGGTGASNSGSVGGNGNTVVSWFGTGGGGGFGAYVASGTANATSGGSGSIGAGGGGGGSARVNTNTNPNTANGGAGGRGGDGFVAIYVYGTA